MTAKRSAHSITIETRPKSSRKRDPIVQRWTCSCGAGADVRWKPLEVVQAEVAAHEREVGRK